MPEHIIRLKNHIIVKWTQSVTFVLMRNQLWEKGKEKKLSSDLVMQYILYQVLKIYIFVKRPSPFNSNALNINHHLRYKTLFAQ